MIVGGLNGFGLIPEAAVGVASLIINAQLSAPRVKRNRMLDQSITGFDPNRTPSIYLWR